MALLDVLKLTPRLVPAGAASPQAPAGADLAAVDAVRVEWRDALNALTALAKTLADPAVKAALAGEAREASTKVAQANASADPSRQLALYRAAVTQLRVAATVAKPSATANAKAKAKATTATSTSTPAATTATASPARPSPAATTAAAPSAAARPAASAKAPPPPGVPFAISVPKLPSVIKKSVSVGTLKFEVKVKPTLKISGFAEVDDAGTTDLSAACVQLALDWFEKTGSAQLAGPGLLANFKVQRQGASFVATTSTQTRLGLLTLGVTLAGLDGGAGFELNAKASVKVLEAEGRLEPAAIQLGDPALSGIRFHRLEVRLGGKLTVAPEWTAMIVRWAIEKTAKEAAAEAAEAAAVAIGTDVVIAGSLVIGGIATIGGGIFAVIQGWGIADLAKTYAPAVAAAQAGFRSGMAGEAAPGDRFGRVGYEHGQRNLQALLERTKKEFPGSADDAVRAAVVAKADAALVQVRTAIDLAVRRGVWSGYLAQHTTALNGSSARWAYVACFGDEPNSKSPSADWQAYLDQHTKLSFMSPK